MKEINTGLPISGGSYITCDGTGAITWGEPQLSITDYLDMICKLSGIPMDWERFSKMNKSELDEFIRIQKIKIITNE